MLLREVDYSKNAEIVNLGIVWVRYVCVVCVIFFYRENLLCWLFPARRLGVWCGWLQTDRGINIRISNPLFTL